MDNRDSDAALFQPDDNVRDADQIYGRGLAPFIGIASASAFVMTITIIVLIMQGNKRSFYHERVSHMQSGMITFMAEVVENRDDNTEDTSGGRRNMWSVLQRS